MLDNIMTVVFDVYSRCIDYLLTTQFFFPFPIGYLILASFLFSILIRYLVFKAN